MNFKYHLNAHSSVSSILTHITLFCIKLVCIRGPHQFGPHSTVIDVALQVLLFRGKTCCITASDLLHKQGILRKPFTASKHTKRSWSPYPAHLFSQADLTHGIIRLTRNSKHKSSFPNYIHFEARSQAPLENVPHQTSS